MTFSKLRYGGKIVNIKQVFIGLISINITADLEGFWAFSLPENVLRKCHCGCLTEYDLPQAVAVRHRAAGAGILDK